MDSRQIKLIIMIALTGAFFVVELVVGNVAKSLSLVADSFHMLSDVFSLVVGLVSIRIASKPKTERLTFGWRRAEVVGSLINGVSLLALCFSIAVDAVERFFEPKEVQQPVLVLIAASVGLAINIIGMLLFGLHGGHHHGHSHGSESDHVHSHLGKSAHKHKHKHGHGDKNKCKSGHEPDHDDHEHEHEHEHEDSLKDSISPHDAEEAKAVAPRKKPSATMQGVFLHILGDALGSIAVIASTLFMWLTTFSWRIYVDPIVSLIVVAILTFGSFRLVKKMVLVVMQSTPTNIDTNSICDQIRAIKGVSDVHDIHVWQLDEQRTVATVHVVCKKRSAFKRISAQVRQVLHHVNVHATTVQPEYENEEVPLLQDPDAVADETVIAPALPQQVRCRVSCVSPACSEYHCCNENM